MTKDQKEYVRDTIDQEGLHYGLNDYSDFDEIEDPTFHSLLRIYREAAAAIEEYVG